MNKVILYMKLLRAWGLIAEIILKTIDTLWSKSEGRKYYKALSLLPFKLMEMKGSEIRSNGFKIDNLSNYDSQFLITELNKNIEEIKNLESVRKFQKSVVKNDVSLNIINNLTDENKLALLEFSISPEVVKIIVNYLGFLPRLAGIFLQYNPYRQYLPAAGSQRFHRDSDIFKSINIFLYLHTTNSSNGRISFYSLKDVSKYIAVRPNQKKYNLIPDLWDKFRVDADDIRDSFPSAKCYDFDGYAGDFLYLDPVNLYHKGGYCPESERFLVQISYYTEEMPKRAYMKNVIKQLQINPENHKLKELLSCPYKRFMLSGFQNYKSTKLPFLPNLKSKILGYK